MSQSSMLALVWFRKMLIAFDEPGLLLRLPDRLDVVLQVVHERVEVSGKDMDQNDAFHRAFGVLVLRHGRGQGHQGDTQCCYSEPQSLLHVQPPCFVMCGVCRIRGVS